jgi:hypothetical protein
VVPTALPDLLVFRFRDVVTLNRPKIFAKHDGIGGLESMVVVMKSKYSCAAFRKCAISRLLISFNTKRSSAVFSHAEPERPPVGFHFLQRRSDLSIA